MSQIPTRAIQKRFEVGHRGGVGQRGSSETRKKGEGVVAKNAAESTSRGRAPAEFAISELSSPGTIPQKA